MWRYRAGMGRKDFHPMFVRIACRGIPVGRVWNLPQPYEIVEKTGLTGIAPIKPVSIFLTGAGLCP
jgi:hypothetical protein